VCVACTGADVVLGMIPLARKLLRMKAEVVMVADVIYVHANLLSA
jgi:hypothetical protein